MDKEPDCFGQEWSSTAVECRGGYDPGFVSPTGGHVRPSCDYFDSCKTRSLLKSANIRSQLIAPTSLIRPSYTPQPVSPVPYSGAYVPGRPVQQAPQQQWMQHPQVLMDPIRMVPMAHEMPAYLTVAEHRHDGESYWAPLWRAVLRSLGKAIGHAVSNFFDRNALR